MKIADAQITVNHRATNTIIAGTTGVISVPGVAFKSGAVVRLAGVSFSNVLVAPDGSSISAAYDATAAVPGNYDVTVDPGDGPPVSSPVVIVHVSVKTISFAGSGWVTYKKDCTNVPYSAMKVIAPGTTVWDLNAAASDCSGAEPQNEAIVYLAGSTMVANATFSVSPTPTQPVPNVRIEGQIPGLGILAATGTLPASAVFTWDGSSGSAPSLTADRALPQATGYYPALGIDWRISADGTACGAHCSNAGHSTNTLYVLLAAPVTTPQVPTPMRTPIELAVKNPGAPTPAEAVAKTWSSFSTGSGPTNIRAWHGQKLYYYPNGPSPDPVIPFNGCALNSVELLTSIPGGGQCGSFAYLLRDSLAANGISSAWFTGVCPIGGAAMLVNNWAFSQLGRYAGESYPYIFVASGLPVDMVPDRVVYGDLTNVDGVPGQNSATPSEKFFGSHFVVVIDPAVGASVGPYLDPSYGRAFASAAEFQGSSVAGYGFLDSHPGGPANAYVVRKNQPADAPGVILVTAPVSVPPTALSPSDGATGVPVTRTLSWSPVINRQDPLRDDPTIYTITIATSADLSSNQRIFNTADTSLAVSLSPGVTYYWKVHAENCLGGSAGTAVHSFATGQ